MLGGPLGMGDGLLSLGILTIIADVVREYSIEAVLGATYQAKIDKLWLSDELKFKIKSRFKQND